MPPEPATWDDRGVSERLRGTRFDDVRWFDRMASTNGYTLEASRSGAPEGMVVVADEQTAGRGRLGRRWVSPPGASLLVSVLLRPHGVAPQRLTMATAVSLAGAVEEVAGFRPGLKWPNDLVVADRKLAGILAEADGPALVVGAGCNVNWGALPEELDGLATACDLEVGHHVERSDLLVALLRRLDRALDDLDGVAEAYRGALDTLGAQVRVERPQGDVVGRAVDLEADGALVVEDDEGRRVGIHVGDVVHLRPR